MSAAINALLEKHGKEKVISAYEHGKFPRSETTKDLQMRFNWDLLWASGLNEFVCKTLNYANGSHIDTALKSICPKIERKY